jgi:dolichol-phosphate mannosyltransferase
VIKKNPLVRLVSLAGHFGQSAALYAGLSVAEGEICVLMDGDGQNDPADISKLVRLLNDADLVCGFRQNRQDTWSRRSASWLANFIRRSVLHDHVRDSGCGLKAMRRADLCHIVPFDGLHRFLPVMFGNAGLRIVEVEVNHRPRRHGKSKYTIGRRALLGLHDLIGVRWLMRRRRAWPKVNLPGAETALSRPDERLEVSEPSSQQLVKTPC